MLIPLDGRNKLGTTEIEKSVTESRGAGKFTRIRDSPKTGGKGAEVRHSMRVEKTSPD
jgi:hypothetical protein